MSNGTTITNSSCCDLIVNHLNPAIRSKRRGQLTTCVLLLHDIARPHSAHATVANIGDLRFECLHPPHSTHLAPSYFHVFRALKGNCLEERSGLMKFKRRCMTGFSSNQKIFSRGIHALVKRWNECTERNGSYVEK